MGSTDAHAAHTARERERWVAETEIVIDAPIERVWSIMLDTARYPEWNPFVTHVDGRAAEVGDAMRLTVRWKGGATTISPERVERVEPPRGAPGARTATLAYRYDAWLHHAMLVRGTRVQSLCEHEGRTHYRSREAFDGWLAFAVPLARVQDGFERHAAALKARAERGPATP